MKNREIKFKRAHFDEQGVFIRLTEWGFIDRGFASPASVYGEGKKSAIDLQFTGLHDKNGKEIYEGDVCNSLENDIDAFIVNEPKWFRCDAFDCYGYEELSGFFYDHNGEPDGSRLMNDIEVIGNIYENPNLLK